MSNIRYGLRTRNGPINSLIENVSASDINYLLNVVPSARVAYSFRLLNPNYSGSCIRVRRLSDNAEQNIGFSNPVDTLFPVLDTTSLTTFVGSGTASVTTWYDQSGNGFNAVQTIAARQPVIVSAGSVVTVNSKPALRFSTGNQSEFVISGLATQVLLDQYFVVNTSDTAYLYPNDGGASQVGWVASIGSALSSSPAGYGSPTLFANNVQYTGTTRNEAYLFLNGYKLVVHQSTSTNTWSTYRWGTYLTSPTFDFIGNLQEMVAWNFSRSSVRSEIQSNINSFYSIY